MSEYELTLGGGLLGMWFGVALLVLGFPCPICLPPSIPPPFPLSFTLHSPSSSPCPSLLHGHQEVKRLLHQLLWPWHLALSQAHKQKQPAWPEISKTTSPNKAPLKLSFLGIYNSNGMLRQLSPCTSTKRQEPAHCHPYVPLALGKPLQTTISLLTHIILLVSPQSGVF